MSVVVIETIVLIYVDRRLFSRILCTQSTLGGMRSIECFLKIIVWKHLNLKRTRCVTINLN